MSTGATILAILSMAAGAFATILMLVFLLACAPNSSPRQWSFLRTLMLIMIGAGVAGIICGVVALFWDRPWLAAGIGGSPIAAALIIGAVLFSAEA